MSTKRISLEQEDQSEESAGTVTKGLDVLLGLERPEEDLTAFFAEFSFPIVGEGNARPGLQSLILNLQARYDRYEATGAFGGVDYVRDANGRRVRGPDGLWATEGKPNIIGVDEIHN